MVVRRVHWDGNESGKSLDSSVVLHRTCVSTNYPVSPYVFKNCSQYTEVAEILKNIWLPGILRYIRGIGGENSYTIRAPVPTPIPTPPPIPTPIPTPTPLPVPIPIYPYTPFSQLAVAETPLGPHFSGQFQGEIFGPLGAWAPSVPQITMESEPKMDITCWCTKFKIVEDQFCIGLQHLLHVVHKDKKSLLRHVQCTFKSDRHLIFRHFKRQALNPFLSRKLRV